MARKTFISPNISCHHCTGTIERELNDLEGVKVLEADPKTKQVQVSWSEPASWEQIQALLEEIGYPAQE